MDPMEDPEIQEWAEGSGGRADYLDFLSQRLSASDWLAVARVFRPRFVEAGGCVLWDRVYDPGNFRKWQEELGDDVRAIESVLNRFRVWQYVDYGDSAEEEARMTAFAEDLAFCWEASLRSSFPGRAFDVQVLDTEDGPVVSFVSRS